MIGWQATAAAGVVAMAASGWAMLERNARLALDAELDNTARDLVACQITTTSLMEGQEIDNAIPDDLGGVGVPSRWLLPSP